MARSSPRGPRRRFPRIRRLSKPTWERKRRKAMLEIQQVNVYYGEFQALFDVSLKVSEGETVITVGPNGAGKSTLLKTISGLLRPRSGSITFMGNRIDRVP